MTTRHLTSDDGVRLFVADEGPPCAPVILFAHEFGGDWRSWDGLVAPLSRSFRCIRYAARGIDPSDAPDGLAFYGQERATADLGEVVKRLGLDRFHLVGCSMGSYTSLRYALAAAPRLRSLTLIGCSSGPRDREERRRHHAALREEIALLDARGAAGAVAWFTADPAYRRLPWKTPLTWQSYLDRLRGHSVEGARQILQTLHWNRQSLFSMASALRRVVTPTTLLFGDEDHPVVEPSNVFLGETLPRAQLHRFHQTGHLVHLEAPQEVLAILQRGAGAT